MFFFIIRRVGLMVIAFFGLLFLILTISRVMPGDPIRLALGPAATVKRVEEMRDKMGLDKPLYTQYYLFLRDLCHGKLGYSIINRRDVSEDLLSKIPATLELAIFAQAIAVILGLPLGILAALYKDRFPDHLSRVVAFLGVSFPRFWTGIMLMLLLSYVLNILPVAGRISGAPPKHLTGLYLLDSILTGNLRAFWDSFLHILLPAFSLGIASMAQFARLVRARMVEELTKDYTLVIKAVGMPQNLNVMKYMFKNAFSATMTTIGLSFGWMLGNAFVIEKVFAWPGMARYGIDAILVNDFNAVVGVTLIVGIAFLVINLLLDIGYRKLDPRIALRK